MEINITIQIKEEPKKKLIEVYQEKLDEWLKEDNLAS